MDLITIVLLVIVILCIAYLFLKSNVNQKYTQVVTACLLKLHELYKQKQNLDGDVTMIDAEIKRVMAEIDVASTKYNYIIKDIYPVIRASLSVLNDNQ